MTIIPVAARRIRVLPWHVAGIYRESKTAILLIAAGNDDARFSFLRILFAKMAPIGQLVLEFGNARQAPPGWPSEAGRSKLAPPGPFRFDRVMREFAKLAVN